MCMPRNSHKVSAGAKKKPYPVAFVLNGTVFVLNGKMGVRMWEKVALL